MREKNWIFVYGTDEFGDFHKIPSYILDYLTSYGVIFTTKFVGYSDRYKANCYQTNFILGDKELVTRPVPMTHEVGWSIYDLETDFSANSDYVLIKDSEIEFNKKNSLGDYGFHWQVECENLKRGKSFKLHSSFTGNSVMVTILQDEKGDIKISSFYKGLHGKKDIKEISILVDDDHDYPTQYTEELSNSFDYDEYFNDLLKIFPTGYFDDKEDIIMIEKNLIKSLFLDNRLNEELKNMIQSMPDKTYSYNVRLINNIYQTLLNDLEIEFNNRKEILKSQRDKALDGLKNENKITRQKRR